MLTYKVAAEESRFETQSKNIFSAIVSKESWMNAEQNNHPFEAQHYL